MSAANKLQILDSNSGENIIFLGMWLVLLISIGNSDHAMNIHGRLN